MKFQGTILKEQGVTFAVVVVKKFVIDNRYEAQKAVQAFQPAFPRMPIVLMGQDPRGVPTYSGRADIVRFLANVPLRAIPWKEYST